MIHALLPWLIAGWVAYIVLLAVWIVLQKRPPLSTLSWLLSLAALPGIGLVVYFFLGPQKIRRQRLRRQRLRALHAGSQRPDGRWQAHLPTRKERLGQLIESASRTPISSAGSVTLYADGEATFDAIVAAIAAAREHVHLEYYIVEPDAVGRRIVEALAERARAGVKVRLLIDALGSPRAKGRFLQPLLDAGGEVGRFHPFRLRPLRPLLNLRNHRKIVVVDGRIGFTGGINLCDVECGTGPRSYHDLHVRIDGPAVGWLQAVFAEDWHYTRKQPLDEQHLFPELLPGPVPTQIIASGPDSTWETIHLAHLQAIADARQRVWLATAYFVPSESALSALVAAALRGVEVRILVPRLSDTRVVKWAGRSYYDELMQAGVRIYEYQPRILHAKALLVDDDCVLLGSANFDQRSFRLNFEAAIAFYDADAARQLERQLEADFRQSRRLVLPRRIGPWRRLGEAAARLLSPLL